MGPAQAIKTGLAKSFQIKGSKAMMLAFGCALIGSSTQTLWANSGPYAAPLEAGIELCLNVPPNRAELEETAIRAGWTIDNEALAQTMLSFLIMENWDDDNVSAGIVAGTFMAKNIMRRPIIEASQLGFMFQDVSFAVLNIERVNNVEPICMMTGPLETEALFVAELGLDVAVSKSGQRRAEAILEDRQLQFIVKDPLDLEAVAEAYPSDDSLGRAIRAEITSGLKPVNLTITHVLQ